MKKGSEVMQTLRDRGLSERLEALAKEHHVTVGEILGDRRFARIVAARHAWWAELRAMGFSYPDIGRLTGRDHASVMKGIKKTNVQGTNGTG